MEWVTIKWISYDIIGVWHYSQKAVVLMDMGLCFFIQTEWLKHKCVKVVPASEVPVIGIQAQNLHNDYLMGKVKETKHTVRPWHHKMYGYQSWAAEGMEMAMTKKKK